MRKYAKEDPETVSELFDNTGGDQEEYLRKHFDRNFESAYRKTKQKQRPDSRTLTDMVNEVLKK